MLWLPFSVKLLKNVYKYLPYIVARRYQTNTTNGELMFRKIKQLTSLPKMGIASSALKVEEKPPAYYSKAKILGRNDSGHETFRLYHLEEAGIYDAALYNPDERAIYLSVFRLEDEHRARDLFRQLCERLSPFYQSSSRVFQTNILQSLLNCLEEHPDMELAVVARTVGLNECLKHEKIASTAIDVTDSNNDNSLLQGAKFGFKGKFDSFLTQAGISAITKNDDKGNTAIHYAVSEPDLLDKLLMKATELGSEVVNKVNNSEETPLHVACMVNHAKGVQVLLDHGADLKVLSDKAYPIHSAVKYASFDCVQVICKHDKESVHLRDAKYGGTPLHWSKKKEVTDWLIVHGADIEAGNKEGETPLHIMIKKKRLDCLVSLLSHGADVNALGMKGDTPLHIAVQVGDVNIVKALIVFGSDVNAVNDKKETARHIATVSKSRFRNQIIHALCLVGATPCNPRSCNYQCNTPFSIEKYPVAKAEKGNELSISKAGSSSVKIDDVAKIMASGARSNVKYTNTTKGKNENDGQSLMKKKRKEDSALCLDGGGIRGLILIQVLLNVERVAKQPIVKLFDWIAGTSTGGILALGLTHGKSMSYLQQLYFRFKDQVFVGSRPYPSEPFEEFLKQEFGPDTKMTSVPYPRTLATGAVSDRIPPALHLFRNFTIPSDDKPREKSTFPPITKPQDQLVWRAARGTGAAPTYFRAMGRMLDGGLIANNPTLDLLSFIHTFYKDSSQPPQATCKKIGLVFSVGTGSPPEAPVTNIDVLRPSTLGEVAKVAFGVQALVEVLIEQATSSTGAVVDRAQSWCEMIDVFYRRLNPRMFIDVNLDEKDDLILVNMLWEAQVYLFDRRHVIKELADRLT